MSSCQIIFIIIVILGIAGTYLLYKRCRPSEPFVEIEEEEERYEPSIIPVYELLDIIRDEYKDLQYKFNSHALPVTPVSKDNYDEYEDYIEDHIKVWNELFDRDILAIEDIHVDYAEETDLEFMLYAHIELEYNKRILPLDVKFHGIYIEDGGTTIQLVDLKAEKMK